jgi:ABC-2 type transport system permease protein
MRGFRSLAMAIARGYVRDRTSLFFTLVFPLMFLVLFGGVFSGSSVPKSDVVEVGPVAVLDHLPGPVKGRVRAALHITKSRHRGAALQQVRAGDVAAAIEQRGSQVVVHYSGADQVQAATVQATLQSIVQGADLAASGAPPKYSVLAQRVEDKSLQQIQFVTPGLLGWAIATGATFGAAMTLVGWRERKLLRRLRLAPVSTGSVVGARLGVSLAVAFGQTLIFVGLAVAFFGLRLSGYWWMAFPLVACATLAFMSIGVLAGAVAKTEEGASSISNVIVLPMAFLSGSFFPIDNGPQWIRTVATLLPLRYLTEGMLDVMVRGLGPSSALGPMGILLGFAAVVGLIASRLFRWEAD